MPAAPDFSQGAAFVRGEYVPIGEACVPITDWGFLRSDATYGEEAVEVRVEPEEGAFPHRHDVTSWKVPASTCSPSAAAIS